MLTSLVLPLFGLLSIYYNFYTLIQYIHNLILLFLCTKFLQVVFVDQILPFNSQFNTSYLLFQYIYPLWQSYYTNSILQHIMLPPPFVLLQKKENRSLTQDVTPFLNNLIFQYTNSLPFEKERYTIHTIPLARK